MGVESVQFVILDIDGVLTDGVISIDDNGVERKNYNVRDGSGVKYLLRSGLRVGIISGRECAANLLRARELGIEDVIQNAKDKTGPYEKLLEKHGLTDDQVCYVGDDLPDLPLVRRSGFGVAVADASEALLHEADYVTDAPGGRGAVREVAEVILRAQDKWDAIMSRYLK